AARMGPTHRTGCRARAGSRADLERRRGGAGRLGAAQGTSGGAHIYVVERLWALPELRLHFHHDVILVHILVDGRDLPLAEGVVEGVVDVRHVDTEARRRGALNVQSHIETA